MIITYCILIFKGYNVSYIIITEIEIRWSFIGALNSDLLAEGMRKVQYISKLHLIRLYNVPFK